MKKLKSRTRQKSSSNRRHHQLRARTRTKVLMTIKIEIKIFKIRKIGIETGNKIFKIEELEKILEARCMRREEISEVTSGETEIEKIGLDPPKTNITKTKIGEIRANTNTKIKIITTTKVTISSNSKTMGIIV